MDRIRITVLFLSLISVLSAAGCQDESTPGSHYGDTLISVHERSESAADRATLKGMQDAIQAYYLSNGSYPGSLDDIQKLMNSPVDSSRYHYNPEDGTIRLLE